ncbi:MAG: hypothetical protein B6D41_01240 [Chloroflexi bacterium UTCFX4]|jgi:type I restriction enzyme S subunit|nr:MAG: hypothetical protein B6D41_01240 [Chloroflexi bacterium UTCFX4]
MNELERYELPQDWEWVNLPSLVTELESGSRPKGGVKKIASGIPSIGGEHLASDGGFKFSTPRYVPESFASKMNKGWVKPFDILIVKDGATTGKTSFVDDKFPFQKAVLNEHVFRLRALSEKIEQKYLFWFLYGHDGQKMIDSAFRGSAQGGINQAFVEAVRVPLPPLPEQHRIVNKIEALFAEARTARAALERAEPLLKKFRQAVLSAAFRGQLTERDANDEPASALLERIRAERIKKWEIDLRAKGKDPTKAKFVEAEPPNTRELGELPERWEWAGLGEISWDAGYGTSQKCDYTISSAPVLRIPNIASGKFDLSDLKYAKDVSRLNRDDALAEGDLIIVRTNGSKDLVGRGAVVQQSFEQVLFYASYLIRFRMVTMPTLLKWTAAIWNSPLVRKYIEQNVSTTAGQYNVNIAKLSGVPIPLPPLAEQQRIVERIESLFAQAEQIERAVEIARRRAEKVEQAILARAFRGEL